MRARNVYVGEKGLGMRITIVRLCIMIYDIVYAQVRERRCPKPSMIGTNA
jgi:hypothetical protein